jgi:hypothetical protein
MNVYQGVVMESRAYTVTAPDVWRIDYTIAGAEGDYLFTQYNEIETPAISPGQKVSFRWWSLGCAAAGVVQKETN